MTDQSRPVRFDGHIPTIIKTKNAPPTTAFANVGREGAINSDELRDICFALGKMLQGIPKEHRKLTVSRLANVAKAHRDNGDSPATYLAIEGLISGWEDWS